MNNQNKNIMEKPNEKQITDALIQELSYEIQQIKDYKKLVEIVKTHFDNDQMILQTAWDIACIRSGTDKPTKHEL